MIEVTQSSWCGRWHGSESGEETQVSGGAKVTEHNLLWWLLT